MQTTPVRWTTADLELFASDSRSETLRERRNRYPYVLCLDFQLAKPVLILADSRLR
ncbi:hypothetical protein [Nostoc sp.]|uniref:hypothetical protein n=1 Tax=Nostoc sp. TaxID=1180 RepID=UPI002FF59B79